MSKHDELSESDMQNFRLNPEIISILSNYKDEKKLYSRRNIKILDWGHGRGQTVALLREKGYSAYGIEVDSLPYYNGIPYFKKKGYIPENILFLVATDCKTQFPDDYFDVVISEQVIEHVCDLENCIAEISRITKPGGIQCHYFPSKWHITEAHLFMPIVHWLPKNYLRFAMIYFNVLLHNSPEWPDIPDKASAKEKAKFFFDYSVKNTFYRTNKEISHLFEKYGLTPKLMTIYRKSRSRFSIGSLLPWQVKIIVHKN